MFVMLVCKFAIGLPSGCQLGFYQIMSPLHCIKYIISSFVSIGPEKPSWGGQLRYLFIYLVVRPSVLS